MSARADEVAGGRWLDIAGGGYNPMTLGRIWALQVGALRDAPPADDLPEGWRDAARTAFGAEPGHLIREDAPPSTDPDRRADGDRRGMEAVARAEAMPALG